MTPVIDRPVLPSFRPPVVPSFRRVFPSFRLSVLPSFLLACGPNTTAGVPSPLEGTALRPSQAPIVGLLDVLGTDSLLGKRVRVLGWCAGAPGLLVGRRVGAWFLGTPDTIVEVRGLVPRECDAAEAQQTLLLLFAQVVQSKPDSGERLLLRLPD